MVANESNVLATRASKEIYNKVKLIVPDAIYYKRPKIIFIKKREIKKQKEKLLLLREALQILP